MLKLKKQLKLNVEVQFITGPHKGEKGFISAITKDRKRVQVGNKNGIPQFHVRNRTYQKIDPQTKKRVKIMKKEDGFMSVSNIKIIENIENN